MKLPLALFLAAPLSLAAAASNILLICVDDLRPELGCYGVDYMKTPNVDALASEGRLFARHYVQAPTCGASRYALLTGTYGPTGNNGLFQRAAKMADNPDTTAPSMPNWFRKHGYQTVSVGKVSHHPGGFGGEDWDDEADLEMPASWDRSVMPTGPWQHPRGAMHGLANGEIREGSGTMAVYQSHDGPDTAYPDGLITEAALHQMTSLAKQEAPFFLAVGLLKPHLPFGAPAQYFEPYRDAVLPAVAHPEKPEGQTTWHKSGEFRRYDLWGRDPNADPAFAEQVRRHYAACVSYADAQVGLLLAKLRELELEENTHVILWGDHGWHLGEHAVWGKHTLFEESLRSPLIIRAHSTPQPGKTTDAVVETVDLFPTICDLAGLPMPEYLDGSSLVPQIDDPATTGRSAISYHGSAVTIRTATHRLVAHKDGHAELYSHTSPEKEARNIADDDPERVLELLKLLHERVPEKRPGGVK